jgi:glutathione S-transferase
VRARLYGMTISHPARAAQLMLEHKGVEYDLVRVPPGLQAVRVPLAGFRGSTVPALQIDGRRVLGTRAISRALEELRPEPPLFPADPERRRAVEEAEEWGDRVLQPIPRRLLRWAVRHQHGMRERFVRRMGVPVPAVAAMALVPVGLFYARREDAGSTERILRDRDELPQHLDRIDALVADGILNGEVLNAADFQIATTLRVLLATADYGALLEGRPAEALARRVWPDYRFSLPPLLPSDRPR